MTIAAFPIMVGTLLYATPLGAGGLQHATEGRGAFKAPAVPKSSSVALLANIMSTASQYARTKRDAMHTTRNLRGQ